MNMEKATQKDRIGKITQRSNRTRTSASKGQKEHKDKDKKDKEDKDKDKDNRKTASDLISL